MLSLRFCTSIKGKPLEKSRIQTRQKASLGIRVLCMWQMLLLFISRRAKKRKQ